MIRAINSVEALKARQVRNSRNAGHRHWHTDFIGTRVAQVEDFPQAFLVELDSGGEIKAHFHQVNQFQVFVAGNGRLGRNSASLIALHYADHHTPYGPIVAGPLGFSLFTIRQKADPGGIYLDTPGYKDMLKPTKKRYLLAENIPLSTEVVLENRSDIALDNVLESVDSSDGLGALMLRMGANMKTTGPDPRITGGQCYLVLNGTLTFDGVTYPTWSTLYVGPADSLVDICSGASGLETLVLSFPSRD